MHMNRRDWMKTAGLAPFAAGTAATSPAKLDTRIVRLQLRHTWTTTMSSSEFRDNLYVHYTAGGITGNGEGAPIVRYKESAELARQAVEAIRPMLTSVDPAKFSKVLDQVFARIEGQWAAKAAIDIALMDWVGQKLGVPLYRYFGLDAADAPVTTFSIGIDTSEITRRYTGDHQAESARSGAVPHSEN
jgi:L-Ala-D/L-Glu epimerase